jgi:hypothetical protein
MISETLLALALLRAVADHDARGLLALTADLDEQTADQILDAVFAIDAHYSQELAPASVDLETGAQAWRDLLARIQHRHVSKYLADDAGA